MGLSVPFTDQNCPGGWSKSPLVEPGQVLCNSQSRPPGRLLEQFKGLGVEVAKAISLKPVGDDPKQQTAGEMFGRRLAKCVPPANPQPLEIEIAQLSDLLFD
jgi:hypothetical protein